MTEEDRRWSGTEIIAFTQKAAQVKHDSNITPYQL